MTRNFAEVMDELNSVESVARLLREQNVKGVRNESCECPVAVYLKRETGAARADVNTDDCGVTWSDGTFEIIDNTFSVSDFVTLFDRGFFPNLEVGYV